jgi:hypothetical protein
MKTGDIGREPQSTHPSKDIKAYTMNRNIRISVAFATAVVLIFSHPLSADAQKKPIDAKKPAVPSKPQAPAARPAANQAAKPTSAGRPGTDTRGNVDNDRPNVSKPGGNNVNAGNRNNIGNNVSIDNSRRDVNVNIDNSKDVRINNNRYTSVRRAPNFRPYPRPPYVYGGFRYYSYHPFFYFPFRPFVWGPMWHPWGFFVATLATTAIIVSIVDNDMPAMHDANGIMASVGFDSRSFRTGPGLWFFGEIGDREGAEYLGGEYWYDQGVYYVKSEGGYTVVAAPVGATIKTLPSGYETVKLDDGSVNYHYGGAFYEKSATGYTVVPPTAGTLVEHVSQGGEEVKIGDVTYVKLGDTYYQPVKVDGKNMYEIASVEEDK